ncbi:hypothetical protein LguiB_013911 [Lonicera macranthoides]
MREEQEQNNPIINPLMILTNFFSLQLDLFYHLFLSLSSPIFSLLSLASESFHRAEEAKEEVDSAVTAAASALPHGGAALLRRLACGLLGAVYVGFVMTVAAVAAAVLGLVVVHLWVEEPVFVRERLDFDYSLVNPTAVFDFSGGGGGGFGGYCSKKELEGGVPVGHTFYVSLVLLMPESDFNREIGMFQLTAELISVNGNVMAKSSHPCMLRFRSFPIRMVRTFVMSIPLILGITSETQKITIPMLKHKEGYRSRTKAIKITLLPRAKTSFLPELYEALILLNSELPWSKELVHKWKWTFCVWVSMYIYSMILVALFCLLRQRVFPVIASSPFDHVNDRPEVSEEPLERGREERSKVSESLRWWQQSKSKRKAMLMRGVLGNRSAGSSASTTTVTRDDASTSMEDVGDSESASASASFRG